MRPTREEEAGRWLAQGRADLADAEYNREGGRHNVACFLAHQAAEKALKAFLFLDPEDEPWGHSIRNLCVQAAARDAEFGALERRVAPLDQYYIPTRYPNGLPGGIPSEAFIREDADRAIRLAAEVVEVAAKKLDER